MSRSKATIAVLMLVAVSFLAIIGNAPDAGAATITTFSNGEEEVAVTFDIGGGMNDTAEILIPENSLVVSATLNISTYHGSGDDHPAKVFLDIGSDGDDEWVWNGTGYGDFGHQTLFLNEETQMTFDFEGPGSNLTGKLRLPYKTDVISADFGVKGVPNEKFEKFQFNGPTFDWMGFYVEAAGDLNGDGRPDFLATGPHRNPRDLGHVYLFFGNETLTDKPDVDLASMDDENFFGYWAGPAGDVNKDGYDDVIVGAIYENIGAKVDAGAAYLYYGGDPMDAIPDVMFYGRDAGEHFGSSVAGVGDVNNDGYDDVLIGAASNDSLGSASGAAYLFFGGDQMDNVSDMLFMADSDGDVFGVCVANAGDINNDGYPDFMIGADWEYHGSDFGAMHIYYGGPSLDNVTDVHISPMGAYYFGYMAAGVGDVNGDGYDDVGIMNSLNEVWLYYGGDPMDTDRDKLFAGGGFQHYFGLGLDGAGDINKDGYDDILIGAPGWETVTTESLGKAYLFWGGEDMDTKADYTFQGNEDWDEYGVSMAGIGDFNNDGFLDFVVGADGEDDGGVNSGAAIVYMFFKGIKDPSVGLENTGQGLWNFTGAFFDDVRSDDLSEQLTTTLATVLPSSTDEHGNTYTDLILNISADGRGAVIMKGIDILYNQTVTLADLASELNDFMKENGPEDDGYYHVPITVVSPNKGGVLLEGLNIVIDEAPVILVPGEVLHPEGSINLTLVDLWEVFDDDFDSDENLTYILLSHSNEAYAHVEIQEGHFLSVDTLTDSNDVNWTGTIRVRLTAEDKSDLISMVVVMDITVYNVEDAPVFTSLPVTTAMEGKPYQYDVNAVDGDAGDVLEYSIVNGPENMTINTSSGIILWTPTVEHAGSQSVEVMVIDGMENVTQDFAISVSVRVSPGNHLPIINSLPTTHATVGVIYTYDIEAYDDDWDILTFTLVEGPGNMTLNKTTGKLDWLPTLADLGNHRIKINVSDGKDRTFQRYILSVSSDGLNHLPEIMGVPSARGFVGVEYYFEFNGSDEDILDTLVFSLLKGPSGMGLSGLGILTWTPASTHVGSHTFKVRLSDGKGFVTRTFTVDVSVNHAPEFTSDPILDAMVKKRYVYKVNHTDIDEGDLVTVDVLRWPSGMVYDSGAQELFWTPSKGQDGLHEISLRLSDGKHASYQNFTIEVKKQPIKEEEERSAMETMMPFLLVAIVLLVVAFVAAMMRKKDVGEHIIEDVFLVYKDGRLMTHHTRRLKPETDEHTITAMLTAIQEFVKQSMPTEGEKQKPIDEISFGDDKIILHHGDYVYIAVVLTGEGEEEMFPKMKETIEEIETEFKDVLEDWDGDLGALDGVKIAMKELLHGPGDLDQEEPEEEQEDYKDLDEEEPEPPRKKKRKKGSARKRTIEEGAVVERPKKKKRRETPRAEGSDDRPKKKRKKGSARKRIIEEGAVVERPRKKKGGKKKKRKRPPRDDD